MANYQDLHSAGDNLNAAIGGALGGAGVYSIEIIEEEGGRGDGYTVRVWFESPYDITDHNKI